MLIEMLTGVAGQDRSFIAGDVTDHFSDKEAKRFIDAGFARKANAKQAEAVTKAQLDAAVDKAVADAATTAKAELDAAVAQAIEEAQAQAAKDQEAAVLKAQEETRAAVLKEVEDAQTKAEPAKKKATKKK